MNEITTPVLDAVREKWKDQHGELIDLPREKLIEMIIDMTSCVNELNAILLMVVAEMRGPLN